MFKRYFFIVFPDSVINSVFIFRFILSITALKPGITRKESSNTSVSIWFIVGVLFFEEEETAAPQPSPAEKGTAAAVDEENASPLLSRTAAAVDEENTSSLISSAFTSGEGGPPQRWMRRTLHRLSPLFNTLAPNPR